jgi:hypothetical protein
MELSQNKNSCTSGFVVANHVSCVSALYLAFIKVAQHSVQWTGGESVRFTGIFLALSFFCSQAFIYARPLSAANASR